MTDEVADLKAELTELNLKCQLARDNEVRYALQRSRLETERAQLLVRMMGAHAAVAPAVPLPQMAHHGIIPPPAAVTDAAVDDERGKPEGFTVQDLVEAALQDEPKGLRPCEITALIRESWWPDAPRWVSSVIWSMAQKGRLVKDGSTYRLNGHGHRKA